MFSRVWKRPQLKDHKKYWNFMLTHQLLSNQYIRLTIIILNSTYIYLSIQVMKIIQHSYTYKISFLIMILLNSYLVWLLDYRRSRAFVVHARSTVRHSRRKTIPLIRTPGSGAIKSALIILYFCNFDNKRSLVSLSACVYLRVHNMYAARAIPTNDQTARLSAPWSMPILSVAIHENEKSHTIHHTARTLLLHRPSSGGSSLCCRRHATDLPLFLYAPFFPTFWRSVSERVQPT